MHKEGREWVLTGWGATGRSQARGPTIVERWATDFTETHGRKPEPKATDALVQWMRDLEDR